MYLKETCIKVPVAKNLRDAFRVQDGLKQGDALLPLYFNFDSEYVIRKVEKTKRDWK
jgi:hypothetical protein